MTDTEGISVAIRIRPLNQREIKGGDNGDAFTIQGNNILVGNPPTSFVFGNQG